MADVDFFEEDESRAKIEEAFAAGEKGITGRGYTGTVVPVNAADDVVIEDCYFTSVDANGIRRRWDGRPI